MLVDNDILRARYVANGTTTDFAIPFPFLDETHITVYTRLDEKDEPISPASYIVEGAGESGGGTIKFRVAPTSGTVIVILRNVPITQMYDYKELDNFSAESHENGLSKRCMVEQQLAEGLERALKMDITDPRTPKQYQEDLFAAMEQASKDAEYIGEYVQDIPVIKSSLNEVAAEDRDGLFWVPGATGGGLRGPDVISVKDFGAVGDGVADDTEAIQAALESGKDIFIPAGTYVISDTLSIPDGVGVWGQGQGYDRYHPTTLLFVGTGTKAHKVGGATSWSIANPDAGTAYLADSGNRGNTYRTLDLTQAFSTGIILGKMSALHYVGVIPKANYTDASATDLGADWDVGVWCKDADEWCLDHVSSFGYWRKAGCLVTATTSCEHGNAYRCNFGGFRGLAIRSADTVSGTNYGLAGTQFIDCDITSLNHASSCLATSSTLSTPFASPSGCLEVSGAVMRGIQFFGCTFLSRDDIMWIMPKCSEIYFFGCYSEGKDAKVNGEWLGTVGSRIITTADSNVQLIGCTKYGVDWSPRYKRESGVTRYTVATGVTAGGVVRDDEYEHPRLAGSISFRLMKDGSFKWYNSDFNEIASLSSGGAFNVKSNIKTNESLSLDGTNIITSATTFNLLRNTTSYIMRVYASGNVDMYGGYTTFEGTIRPKTDNTLYCGTSSQRWNTIYAGTATINTSDERQKTEIKDPDEALMRAWSKVGFKVFQFKDAVEKKGSDARIHVGVIAQQVHDAFASEGLDASRYGLFCHDHWEKDEEAGIEAGDAYGIRYEEALALECTYQRWELNKIKARLGGM